MREGLILVSRMRHGCPLSAEFILGVVLVQQFDVCEGKVATFAFTFTLPLAVHVYFGHLHHVAHLRREQRQKGVRVQQEGAITRFIIIIKDNKNTDNPPSYRILCFQRELKQLLDKQNNYISDHYVIVSVIYQTKIPNIHQL